MSAFWNKHPFNFELTRLFIHLANELILSLIQVDNSLIVLLAQKQQRNHNQEESIKL